MSDSTIGAMIWDGMEPDERRCMAMIIDAINGPPEYIAKLDAAFSKQFQLSVCVKRDWLAQTKSPTIPQ